MKTLFDTHTHQEVLQRIESLSENSTPNWGKMNVGQMLKHCQFPLEVANSKLKLNKPNLLMGLFFKLLKSNLYNDKLWNQNLPTSKEYLVTDKRSFTLEKEKLLQAINEFEKKSTNLHWPPHPAFGKFTTDQWGKMQYKHLDHHLRQFGV